MVKRVSDWLEKTSVASFAVGVFQERALGICIAAFALALSLALTYERKGD